ncbi:hypothetical protein K7432_006710 [Basidiobolus ranarum]|uniref:Uncharacterized protein n=1 Tax=Basidiobolus ranarum TaxID=34480 RepID=A0ABR2W164_9FUNG
MISKPKIFLVVIVALLFAYVRNLMNMTGVFRKVQDFGMEKCEMIEQLRYCESLQIERETGLVYLSCEVERDRWNPVMGRLDERVDKQSGSIWVYNLTDSTKTPHQLQLVNFVEEFHPLGMSITKHPHEADTLLLYVVNLRRASKVVEIFKTNLQKPSSLEYIRTIQHVLIKNPNELDIDTTREPNSEGLYSFYVSNDHGSTTNTIMHTLETLLGFPLSNVVYYNVMRETAKVVANYIQFANGIALSQSEKILFVSSTSANQIFGYNIENGGDFPKLHFNSTLSIPVDMSVDNIDVDPSTGEIFAAGHPRALDFLQFVKDRESVNSPSKVVRVINPENQSRVETVFSDSGAKYATSSSAAIDYARGFMVISGLYENGALVCNV